MKCISLPGPGICGRTLHGSACDRAHIYRATADVESSPATQSVLELDPVYEGEYCSKHSITRAWDPWASRTHQLVQAIHTLRMY